MSRTKLISEDLTNEERIIAEYIEENASDDLVIKINTGEKGMADCWKYIFEQARNKAKGNKSLCLADEVVFGWAVHYFEEDSIKKGETPKPMTKDIVEKKKVIPKKQEVKKPEKNSEDIPGQMTILDFMGV